MVQEAQSDTDLTDPLTMLLPYVIEPPATLAERLVPPSRIAMYSAKSLLFSGYTECHPSHTSEAKDIG